MKVKAKFKFNAILILALMMSTLSIKAQTIGTPFFNQVNSFLKVNVADGLVAYENLVGDKQLKSLLNQIENADLSGLDDASLQAFYINAYNLHVINKVSSVYPISSVMDNSNFFNGDKIKVANEQLTLNQLEKEKLLKKFGDPRYHFVLVCGALGCPPITNFAYTPQDLDQQLEQQTKLALNDKQFIRSSDGKVQLSEIFKWYTGDFGGTNKSVINFINKYRNDQIPASSKLGYYNYDWKLNGISKSSGHIEASPKASNQSRYIVSSTIPTKSIELKIFNNLYSQQTGSVAELTNRSSFFTTSISALYGLSKRVNIGINTRFRKVRNNDLPSSPFSVFGSGDEGSARSGITAFGPQIRFAPVPKWSNFSIQSSFVFPIGEDLAGSATEPYIDWNGATWNTQFFNDFSIGTKFSLFTELDFLIEDIGASSDGHINRFSTPLTLIYSYIPTNKLTFYVIGGYSPYWQSDYDYFTQFGLGSKYQFTPDVELELLYTDFSNKFLNETGGKAETINLGIRLNLFR